MLRVNDYPLLIIPLNLVRSFIITYDKRAYTLFQYNIYFKYTTEEEQVSTISRTNMWENWNYWGIDFPLLD
jgi:hypothetical protein